MERLLRTGTYPAIATHDERLVRRAIEIVRRNGIATDRFEFQMLYGVRRDLQERLAAEGLSRPRLRAIRARVVPVLHAPDGGTAGQPRIRVPEHAAGAQADGLRDRPRRQGSCRSSADTNEDRPGGRSSKGCAVRRCAPKSGRRSVRPQPRRVGRSFGGRGPGVVPCRSDSHPALAGSQRHCKGSERHQRIGEARQVRLHDLITSMRSIRPTSGNRAICR